MWTAGVLPLEVMAAHFLTQLGILAIQSSCVVIVVVLIFKLYVAGSVGFGA